MKLYRFQVYNSIIHHLHIVLCVHTPTQVSVHHHLSPLNALLSPSSPFPSSNHHTVVCAYNFCFYGSFLLNPFIFLTQPHKSPSLWQLSVYSLPLSLFLFCLLIYLVHYIPLMNEVMWYFSFFDCLISLSIMLSRSIHGVAKGKIFFFFKV